MKILITGIAGGIGSTLGHRLFKLGHEIVGVDSFENGHGENLTIDGEQFCKFYKLRTQDFLILGLLGYERPDVVVHLAATSSLPECEQDSCKCYLNNTMLTQALLESARNNNVKKFIFASSSAVYENNNEKLLSEELIVKPMLAYPLSKKLSEDICLSYIEKYNMNVSILRFFNVFGPRQDIYRKSPPLINYIVREMAKGNVPQLHSDGNQSRDYISVDKVCKSILGCIEKTAVGIYNVCSGQVISVKEIYDIINKTLAFHTPAQYNKSENLWKDYNLDLKESTISKEVNKFSLGLNNKIQKDLNINLSEDTKSLISSTSSQIYNNYKN